MSHSTFQQVEFGYQLTPLASLANSQLNPGQSYTFDLKFSGSYTSLTASIISTTGARAIMPRPRSI
ncbi:MAG: hypothetical protein JOZ69_12460 [Myxococcales bacterium]|nr:hypothetical protein [Myxococcales bacterium]